MSEADPNVIYVTSHSARHELSKRRWREASDRFLGKALIVQASIVALLFVFDLCLGLPQLGAILQHHLLLGISAYIALQTGDKSQHGTARSTVIWAEVSILSLGAIGAFVSIWHKAYGITDSFESNGLAFEICAAALVLLVSFCVFAHRSAHHAAGGRDETRSSRDLWLLLFFVNASVGALFWAETVDVSRGDNPIAKTFAGMAADLRSVAIYVGLLVLHAALITIDAIATRQSVRIDVEEGDVEEGDAWKPSTPLDFLIWPFAALWAALARLWRRWTGPREPVVIRPRPEGEPPPPKRPLAVSEGVGWAWSAIVVMALLFARPGALSDPVCAPLVGKPQHCVTVYFATPRKPIESADAKLAATSDRFWRREARQRRNNNNDVDPRPLGFGTNESGLANALYLGRANVSVPLRKDKIANEDGSQVIERNAIVVTAEEQAQVEVTSIEIASDFGFDSDPPLVATRFYDRLAGAATAADNKLLLVVHGFNTKFDESLALAGRYAVDLNAAIDGDRDVYGFGQPLLFTWHTSLLFDELGDRVAAGMIRGGATGTVFCAEKRLPAAAQCGAAGAVRGAAFAAVGSTVDQYREADKRADEAAYALRSFLLTLLSEKSGDKPLELNIFAVSLGNAVLTRAIAGIDDDDVKSLRKDLTIRIISAGGDASHEEFRDALERLGERISKAAIYVNRDDLPLFLSQVVRLGEYRVGRPDNAEPFTLDGGKVETIDATGLRTGAWYDPDATHSYGQKSPTTLADSACFFEGVPPDRRFLRRHRDANGAEKPWWEISSEGLDTRCEPKLLPPIDCDSLEVKWTGWWPFRSASEKERLDRCRNPKCVPEIIESEAPAQAALHLTPLAVGELGSRSDNAFLCKSSQYIGPTRRAVCPEAQLQGRTLMAALQATPGICSQDALLVIGSASSYGDNTALGQKRALAIEEAVEKVCSSSTKPATILLSVGMAQCAANSDCENPLDRRLTVFGIKDLRDKPDAIMPELVIAELEYALGEADEDDEAWSIIRRAALGQFAPIELFVARNWQEASISAKNRSAVRTQIIKPNSAPECRNEGSAQ